MFEGMKCESHRELKLSSKQMVVGQGGVRKMKYCILEIQVYHLFGMSATFQSFLHY